MFDLREERDAQLRKARVWLIVVGIIMFVTDMVYIHAINKDWLTDDDKTHLTMLSGGVMVAFFALAFFTKQKPKLCLILGLVIFWGLQLYGAMDDPSLLFKGLLLKIFFTAALIKGLQAASQVERLNAELVGKVFE
jgi:peptidoglycan/LPS O-acetylase OafA/YrhL